EQTENCLGSTAFIIEVDQGAQTNVIRRPIARGGVTLFEREQYFFFDRSRAGSPAEATHERQCAVIFARCGLLLDELKQRRQLITRCSFSSDAANSFSNRAVKCRQ